MNTPLRDEILEILNNPIKCETPGCTVKHHNPASAATDEILNLIASKMPEKKVYTPNGTPEFDAISEYKKMGYNYYHDSVKSILKGGTE